MFIYIEKKIHIEYFENQKLKKIYRSVMNNIYSSDKYISYFGCCYYEQINSENSKLNFIYSFYNFNHLSFLIIVKLKYSYIFLLYIEI